MKMGGPDRVWNYQHTNRRARLERAGSALGTALSGKIWTFLRKGLRHAWIFPFPDRRRQGWPGWQWQGN
jgi:hypothetical protein